MVSFLIIPYSEKPEMEKWLKSSSIIVDKSVQKGAYPHIQELLRTIKNLPDCQKQLTESFFNDTILIECGGHRAELTLGLDDNDVVDHLGFTGSVDIVLAITRKLAQIKGSFLILVDGEAEMLINPSRS